MCACHVIVRYTAGKDLIPKDLQCQRPCNARLKRFVGSEAKKKWNCHTSASTATSMPTWVDAEERLWRCLGRRPTSIAEATQQGPKLGPDVFKLHSPHPAMTRQVTLAACCPCCFPANTFSAKPGIAGRNHPWPLVPHGSLTSPFWIARTLRCTSHGNSGNRRNPQDTVEGSLFRSWRRTWQDSTSRSEQDLLAMCRLQPHYVILQAMA